MALKTYLAVVCVAVFSVSFSSSLIASGGAGKKNKKTIIVQVTGADGEIGTGTASAIRTC